MGSGLEISRRVLARLIVGDQQVFLSALPKSAALPPSLWFISFTVLANNQNSELQPENPFCEALFPVLKQVGPPFRQHIARPDFSRYTARNHDAVRPEVIIRKRVEANLAKS